MPDQTKIRCLQDHIQLLLEEISSIDLKNPNLSAEEYLREKNRLQSLKNLRAIARNELNSMLHQYRFTLTGKIVAAGGQVAERIVRTRVFTELDCRVVAPAMVRVEAPHSQPLIEIVKKDFSTYFLEGTLAIKSIKKLS